MEKVHCSIENQTSFGNLQTMLCCSWMEFKNMLLVQQVKARIVNSEGNKSTSLPSALWFLFAGVSVNPGTCWGRRTGRCFPGHRPGSTSSFYLLCCAYVSSGCLDAAPLSSFWMGAGDGGSCAGHPWGCRSRGGVRLWSRVTAATRSARRKSRVQGSRGHAKGFIGAIFY